MDIRERAVGDITILDLSGQLILGDPATRLKDKINSLVQEGRRKLIANLGGITYIDSTGLGQLISSYTTVTRQGGRFVLLNVTKRARDLLAVTKLLTVFDTFDAEDEAVRSLGSGASPGA